jgi:hypothetical protein
MSVAVTGVRLVLTVRAATNTLQQKLTYLLAVPFIVSWTKLDTGVFVLPETALGSYSLRLECVESASKRCMVRAI